MGKNKRFKSNCGTILQKTGVTVHTKHTTFGEEVFFIKHILMI